MKTKPESMVKKIASVAAGILLAVLLTLPYLLFRDAIQDMETMGYMSLLISCALANAAIFLPTSSTIVVLVAGTVLNPWLCVLFGGIGAALGEQVSYLCGRIGRQGFIRQDIVQPRLSVVRWMQRNAFLTVFLFALVPLPIFDLVGIAAGAMKMSWLQYACAAALGKVVRLFLVVFLFVFFFQNGWTGKYTDFFPAVEFFRLT